MKKIDVYGVCNPLIDLLCHIPDEFLQQLDLEKNRMYLVSTDRQHSILKELENRSPVSYTHLTLPTILLV